MQEEEFPSEQAGAGDGDGVPEDEDGVPRGMPSLEELEAKWRAKANEDEL